MELLPGRKAFYLKFCAPLRSEISIANKLTKCKLDVHGSVHRNIKVMEGTNKMQPCSRIYYSNVS
jgi:hypothetical protein